MKKVFVILVIFAIALVALQNVNANVPANDKDVIAQATQQKTYSWGDGNDLGNGVTVYYGYSVVNGRKSSTQDVMKFKNTNNYSVKICYYMSSNSNSPNCTTCIKGKEESSVKAKSNSETVSSIESVTRCN